MRDIAAKLRVSKASVSLWVRDVTLTQDQRHKLNRSGYSVDAIEKRRINRLEKTRLQHEILMKQAGASIVSLSRRDLWLLGIALYWGEGGKTNKGMARISNTDPAVIQLMMRFFREICEVPEKKFRGHIHTFSHLKKEAAEKYWSKISEIPRGQFYKTYTKQSSASKNKRDKLPCGTFQIYVCDTKLFFKIMGWIERVKELSLK